MALPRLAPAANPYTVELTFTVNTRPYFEAWYNNEKEQGETPKAFLMRKLREQVVEDYATRNQPSRTELLKAAYLAADADRDALKTEVD